MIKAMVLGAVACAFSVTGFAADVQNGHGQGIADSTTYTDNLFLNVGKNFVDTTVGTDVLTSLMKWVRNVQVRLL